MKIEKQLAIIGCIAAVITMVLFFMDSDAGYPGFSGFLKTAFELLLMTGMIFLVIAINFFAVRFIVKKLFGRVK